MRKKSDEIFLKERKNTQVTDVDDFLDQREAVEQKYARDLIIISLHYGI